MHDEKECNQHIEKGEYEKAIELGESLVNQKPENYNAHYCLAKVYYLARNFSKSIEHAERMEKLADGDEIKLAEAYKLLGLAYRGLNQLYHALMYHMKELELQIKIGNKSGEVEALRNIAGVYEDKGDYDKSLMFYEEALKLVDDQRIKASILDKIGDVYYKRGEYEMALKYFDDAVITAERIGDYEGSAQYILKVGNAYRKMGKLDKAEKFLLEGLERIKVLQKEGEAVFKGYKYLGRFYFHNSNYEKALENLYKALLIVEKIMQNKTNHEYFRERGDVLRLIAHVLEQKPELKDYLINKLSKTAFEGESFVKLIEDLRNRGEL